MLQKPTINPIYCYMYTIMRPNYMRSNSMRYNSIRLVSMCQCISCGSFDVGRIHRNILERFLIKKIYLCHECDHKWKIWK